MIQIIIDPDDERLDGGTFKDTEVKELMAEIIRLNSRQIEYEIRHLVDMDRLHL